MVFAARGSRRYGRSIDGVLSLNALVRDLVIRLVVAEIIRNALALFKVFTDGMKRGLRQAYSVALLLDLELVIAGGSAVIMKLRRVFAASGARPSSA